MPLQHVERSLEPKTPAKRNNLKCRGDRLPISLNASTVDQNYHYIRKQKLEIEDFLNSLMHACD